MLRKFLFGSSVFFMQLWLGASLFLSFVLAPILFQRFGVEVAADVMGAVFPAYGYIHVLGASAGLIGFALAWRNRGRIGQRIYFSGLGALTCAWLGALAQAGYLFPRSRELRAIVKDGRLAGEIERVAAEAETLMRLHKFSVGINNATLAILLFLAWVYYRVARDWDKI